MKRDTRLLKFEGIEWIDIVSLAARNPIKLLLSLILEHIFTYDIGPVFDLQFSRDVISQEGAGSIQVAKASCQRDELRI